MASGSPRNDRDACRVQGRISAARAAADEVGAHPGSRRRALTWLVASVSSTLSAGCAGLAATDAITAEDAADGVSSTRTASSVAAYRFDAPPFAGWSVRDFPGKRPTRYRIDQIDGRVALRADANASVSMARRSVRVDSAALHRVQFAWRVPRLIAAADLRDRHAEDAPVRVVLAFDGDRSRLPMRDRLMFELAQAVTGEVPPYATLMYVWERSAMVGDIIPSNSTGRIQKLVVDTGESLLDTWRDHDRDIVTDFRRAFGEAPGPLAAVGVMTDTDNTRSRARAWYGGVRLVGAQGVALPLDD